MTSYPMATLAAQVSATGIAAPSYDDVFLSLQASYQGIYGSDVILTADTQDGQWLAIVAQAVTDVNAAAIAIYNSFSPTSAQGTGLSGVVKINGIRRNVATNSTVNLAITGTVGTTITNGAAADAAGNIWNLPASVIIPTGNTITVTATAADIGAIAAAPGTVTTIQTPTLGWLSVTNASAAVPGAAVETDAQLRARQTVSTSISAISPMEAVVAAVSNLAGVTRLSFDENATNTTDGNGVPAHSIALVVQGGDAQTIAQTIARNKTPGTGTYGAISETVIDNYGVPSTINFSAPTEVRIIMNVVIAPLAGYSSTIGNNIVAAVQGYVNGLAIGEDVYLTQVISAAIQGSGSVGTFNLTALTMAPYPSTPAAADITIAYSSAASLAASDVTLVT